MAVLQIDTGWLQPEAVAWMEQSPLAGSLTWHSRELRTFFPAANVPVTLVMFTSEIEHIDELWKKTF